MKRCVYGIDLNPMAVELANVSVWLDGFMIAASAFGFHRSLIIGQSWFWSCARLRCAGASANITVMRDFWLRSSMGRIATIDRLQRLLAAALGVCAAASSVSCQSQHP